MSDFPTGAGLQFVRADHGSTAFESSVQIDRAVSAQLADGQSLYTLNVELLAELKPDLIITQRPCRSALIDTERGSGRRGGLAAPGDPVAQPSTVEGVLEDILEIGRATGRLDVAAARVAALRERRYRAEELVTPFAAAPTVVFLEWTDPLFVGGHWTPQLIERAGGLHPLNPTSAPESAGAAAGPIGQTLRAAGPSIRIPADVVAAIRPDRVIVCPCGLSLEDAWRETQLLSRQAWWRDLPAVRAGRVAVVDGNQMFNRPGPRLVDAFEWLVGWLNDRPELIAAGFPWRTLA